MSLLSDIELFRTWVQESSRIVFFGGAGVSTESGIPDFRSTDGLYQQKYTYPPETIVSHHFFLQHPSEFYDFYRTRMMYPDAKPNITHRTLAALEADGKLAAVVTQNIDGLHQLAGSQKVLELHGSIQRNYCMNCGRYFNAAAIKNAADIPLCSCGSIIKPDVVLYEESLDQKLLAQAVQLIRQADLLIVGGTSLSVYPAAGLIEYYAGDRLVLINKTETPYDSQANLVLHDSLGTVFSNIAASARQS